MNIVQVNENQKIDSHIKEFLDPLRGYQYIRLTQDEIKENMLGWENWIVIPKGSEVAVLLFEKLFFWKDDGITHWSNSDWYSCNIDTPSVSYMSLKEFINEWEEARIVWEVLPKIEVDEAKQTANSETSTIDTTSIHLNGEAAKQAWVNGSKIQISPIQDIPEWEDLNEKIATLDCFQKKWLFRCKPLTIMINGTELKPWNSIQVNYEKFIIKIECVDSESADKSYKALQQVFSNRSVNWSKN